MAGDQKIRGVFLTSRNQQFEKRRIGLRSRATTNKRARNKFVAVTRFVAKTLFALKSRDFFGAKATMLARRAFGFQKPRVFPTLHGGIAHAAKSRDLSGCQVI